MIKKSQEAKEYFIKIRSIDEKDIWKVLYDLTNGLKKLHELSIAHRDLKCANVFKSDNVYKIGDMNVSKVAKY